MPESIIDLLEAIEIDEHQDASRFPGFTGFSESGFKLSAIGKPGHHIVPREILYSFELFLFFGNVLLDTEEPDRFAVLALDGGEYSDPTRSDFGNPDFGIKPEARTSLYRIAADSPQTSERVFRIASQDLAADDPTATLKTKQVVGSVAPGQSFAGQFALPEAHSRGDGSPLENLEACTRGFRLAEQAGLVLDLTTQLPNSTNVEGARQGQTQTGQERIEAGLRWMTTVGKGPMGTGFRLARWITHLRHLRSTISVEPTTEYINRR